MRGFTRRRLIEVAASGPAILALPTPSPRAGTSEDDSAAMADAISAELFAGDGLARPIPDTPTVSDLAQGDRAQIAQFTS